MDTSFEPRAGRRQCPNVPRLHLHFGAMFWRIAILVLAFSEYKVWRFVRASVPRDEPVRRVLGVIYFTPRALFLAFAIAAAVTVAIDLFFRLFVRPAMILWYHPRSRDKQYTVPIAFQLAAREAVQTQIPARRMLGRKRIPGTLVKTNQRLAFFPFAWDGEVWEVALDRVHEVTLEPTVRRVLGFVRGYPDHIVVQDDGGSEAALIVAEPDVVVSWFA